MDHIVVCLVALFVSALTLFSGFGLGTVLMPAFALFFPVPVAVAAPAVVHLANNFFKVSLVGRKANWSVVVKQGNEDLFDHGGTSIGIGLGTLLTAKCDIKRSKYEITVVAEIKRSCSVVS